MRGTPAAVAARTAEASSRVTSAATSAYRASLYIARERPRLCISTSGAPEAAATRAMAGSYRSAETSFTIDAPAASARRATSAL